MRRILRERNRVSTYIKDWFNPIMEKEVKAIGGTITYVGKYVIHTFTSDGIFTVLSPVNIEVFLVGGGGGGGGGSTHGGGGGGGGYTQTYDVFADIGDWIVTIGTGGEGMRYGAGKPGGISSLIKGEISYIANGGSGGGAGSFPNGGDGGSGGGAGKSGDGGTDGGDGGATSPETIGGTGQGTTTTAFGEGIGTKYGGGGGGGEAYNGTGVPGSGGIDGGGDGGAAAGSAYGIGGNGQNGIANTGGGGGGGGGSLEGAPGYGGNGGSGIVIIRYQR